jgi:hypothetical protein
MTEAPSRRSPSNVPLLTTKLHIPKPRSHLQAALHGLLTKIRDLGLPLLSVAREESEEEVKRAQVEKRSQEVPK